jgi:hypothetical protein
VRFHHWTSSCSLCYPYHYHNRDLFSIINQSINHQVPAEVGQAATCHTICHMSNADWFMRCVLGKRWICGKTEFWSGGPHEMANDRTAHMDFRSRFLEASVWRVADTCQILIGPPAWTFSKFLENAGNIITSTTRKRHMHYSATCHDLSPVDDSRLP